MLRFFLISILLSAAAFGADGQLDRATLKGLKSVGIVVDTVDADLAREGIDPDFLRAAILTKLEKAGIAVEKDAVDFLGLRVTAAQGKRMPAALCLSLGLYQPVILSRDPNARTVTETWSVDSLASAQPKAVKDAAADLLTDLVARFVTAYGAVNAK